MTYYDWPQILSKQSDDDLKRIILNQNSEPSEKVAAAGNELEARGIAKENFDPADKEVTTPVPLPDENSPILYSDKVIYTFSVLFTVIFGGILFAMNLKTVNNKKGIFPVILFSILYFALSAFILSYVNIGTPGAVISGMLGALVINKLFWIKYIGKGVVYHKRSYKMPLIIALCIFTPLTALIIWAMIITTP